MSTVPAPLERRRGSLTKKSRSTFLEALAQAYSVTHAAQRAGVSRQTLYAARKDDEEFAAAWADAIETGTQLLEDELRRRAIDGWTEDTLDANGNLVRRVQRISPQDLHFQLKARRPELYRDNAKIEVTQNQSVVALSRIDQSAEVRGVVRVLVACEAYDVALSMLATSGCTVDVLDGETAEALRAHAQSGHARVKLLGQRPALPAGESVR